MCRRQLLNLLTLLALAASAACAAKPVSPTPEASPVPSDQAATFTPAVSTAAPEVTSSASPLPPSSTPTPPVLRVAYFGAGQIRLWTEGAGSRRLAAANNVEQIRLSDDGRVVAYLGLSAQGTLEISAVNADGSGQRVLAGQDYWQRTLPAGATVSLDFAPASHTLYFTTSQYDLHRVDAAQGAPAAVFQPGQGGFFSFSPDGRWMTLYHPNELVLARLDGSDAHVAFQFPEDFRWTNSGPEIRWKPDGSGFYVVSASGPQGSANNMTVWFVPVAGQPVKQMPYTGPYGANLSPDGRAVVYLYYQHEPVDVHVVTPDGKDTLYGSYPSNVGFMGWAPDSKHFLLDLSQDARLKVPYLCALGEKPVKLVDTDDALPAAWVDAQRVLFASHGTALRLQRLGAPSIVLDAEASASFGYATFSP